MKIEVNTTERAVTRINMILKHAMNSIEKSDDLKEYFDVKEKDFKSIESFRQKMIKGLFKNRKNGNR